MPITKTTKKIPPVSGKLRVLFVGDSQTDYAKSYANLLLGNEVTGTLISKVGAAMSTIYDYFKEGYVKGQFDIVSVMGGNNDATTKKFNKSFAEIVNTVTSDGGKVVIVTCPSVKYVNKGNSSSGDPYWPYFSKSKKATGSDYYEYADDIAKWQKGLADKNVIIVDAHNQLDDKKYFSEDGLHLNSDAHIDLKKLWLEATSSASNTNNTPVNNNTNTATNTDAQQTVANGTVEQPASGISDATIYKEFTNTDFPTDIQTRCTFDVTKNSIYQSESGIATIAAQTYVISNPAPDSKLVKKLDGTMIELGDLTLVKKEDPFDPEIIRLLTPYSEEREQLDPEYTEGTFSGEEDAKLLELMTEDWEAWTNPNYVPQTLGIEGYDVNASGSDIGGSGDGGSGGDLDSMDSSITWSGNTNWGLTKTEIKINVGGELKLGVYNLEKLGGKKELNLVKSIIAFGESAGNYYAYNWGNSGSALLESNFGFDNKGKPKIASRLPSLDLTFNEVQKKQLPKSVPGLFAVGKYQTIPSTLKGHIKSLDLGDKPFSPQNQEKVAENILKGASGFWDYVYGKNKGEKKHLNAAIQSISQVWAALPTIKVNGVVVGDVDKPKVNGDFNRRTYYGGVGANHVRTSIYIGNVAAIIIETRYRASSEPKYIPNWFKRIKGG
jgi:predicted DNA-binding transcriptional regulator AlpA